MVSLSPVTQCTDYPESSVFVSEGPVKLSLSDRSTVNEVLTGLLLVWIQFLLPCAPISFPYHSPLLSFQLRVGWRYQCIWHVCVCFLRARSTIDSCCQLRQLPQECPFARSPFCTHSLTLTHYTPRPREGAEWRGCERRHHACSAPHCWPSGCPARDTCSFLTYRASKC